MTLQKARELSTLVQNLGKYGYVCGERNLLSSGSGLDRVATRYGFFQKFGDERCNTKTDPCESAIELRRNPLYMGRGYTRINKITAVENGVCKARKIREEVRVFGVFGLPTVLVVAGFNEMPVEPVGKASKYVRWEIF